jgi:hypothetical protein
MRLFVGASSEEQGIRRPTGVVGVATAEGNPPEAVDHDPLLVLSLEEVDELEGPVGLHLIGKDLAVAEIADEQISAERPEIGRREG